MVHRLSPPVAGSLSGSSTWRVLFEDTLQFVRSIDQRPCGRESWSPLLGFIGVPSAGALPLRPLQGDLGGVPRRRPSEPGCHTRPTFRPCRSSRLRRFPPCGLLQVCCALQPAMRFAPFPTCGEAPSSSRDLSISRCFRCSRSSPVASCMHTPFRAFPSSPAVPRHRGLVFPPAVSRPFGQPDLRALLVRRIRCSALALPPAGTRCSPGLSSPSGFSPSDQPANHTPCG